jgi:NADH-quinone oxidoreductase subunit G
VVALELRSSEVTEAADVVFPVAPVTDKSGVFVNWEGRVRAFDQVLQATQSLPDLRVLAGIADEMGVELGFRTVAQVQAELRELDAWNGDRDPLSALRPRSADPGGGYLLASWKQLLDDGRMQDGDDHLRATARRPVLLASPATLAEIGVVPGAMVTVTGPRGSLELLAGEADLADGTVWAPASAPGGSVRHRVGPAGCRVTITGGAA